MKRRLIHFLPWALAGLFAFAWVQARRDDREQQAQLAALTRRQAELRYELKEALRTSDRLLQEANTLDTQLGSAKSRTTATEAQQRALAQTLTATQQELTAREQRENALLAELTTLRKAAAASPVTPDQRARIATLETQLAALLTRALAEPVADTLPPAVAPRQIVRLGPEAAFVIVDYGTQQGAQPGEIIRLQRGTSVLAQAQISDAHARFSVAHVQPASVKGQLQTGDLVLSTK